MDSASEKTRYDDKDIGREHHRHRFVRKNRLLDYDDIESTSASDSDDAHAQEDTEAIEEECRLLLARNSFMQSLLTDSDESEDDDDETEDVSDDDEQPPKKRTRVTFPWRDAKHSRW